MFVEGEQCWVPSEARIGQSGLISFMSWLADSRGLAFADYDALWRWSVDDADAFWSSLWDFFGFLGTRGSGPALSSQDMVEAHWFEGSRVNYAEHMLRHEFAAAPDEIAILHSSETRPLARMSWSELGGAVRQMATRLRAMGLQPGDRVVSYMPNIVETAIAMLATTATGAVWSSAAPEFGVKTVVDRFGQVEPKLLFAADGYRFGGKTFDRRKIVQEIVEELPSLAHVVWLPYLELGDAPELTAEICMWSDLTSGPPVAAEDFSFERVPSDHPLWILFSSGTTGLPKAIVHGHLGMLLDQSKTMTMHFDLKPGQSMFFYTTAGWMMWNAVMSALLTGASAVLYDGSPIWPDKTKLWQLAEDTGTTMFGASPTLVKMMDDAGIVPGKSFNLQHLDKLVLGGAPATPATYDWIYSNVKQDLWVMNTSGGTDLCGSLLGPVPTRPVRAAEMQGVVLGIKVEAWDDDGHPLTNAIGELVITKPYPSQPLFFWGDERKTRYVETYFSHFPGVWWHGDFIKITDTGGCYVYGRSDATLNRFGVRIGTAEIYNVIEEISRVTDSLVVCCETPDGGFFMPMFVQLAADDKVDEALLLQIGQSLREQTSPRHVPDVIIQVPAIPYTLSGKRLEIPVRKVLMGTPLNRVVAQDALADPEAMDWFVTFAGTAANMACRSS